MPHKAAISNSEDDLQLDTLYYIRLLFISLCAHMEAFRFVEGIWLHRKSRQIRKRPILPHMCATCSELPSYISTILCLKLLIRKLEIFNIL